MSKPVITSLPNNVVNRKHKLGSFSLNASGNVLMLYPKGTWSMICAKDYFVTIAQLRARLNIDDFAFITQLQDWELAPPDVLDAIKAFNLTAAEKGMKAQWLIRGTGKQIPLLIASKMAEDSIGFAQIADSLDDCINGLDEQGFNFDKAEIKTFFQS